MKYALGNMLNGAGGLNADQLALDLQFAADKTLTARKGPTPVLTRGSTGTFVGSNGLIQTAAVNAARFDHDPVTLASRGLLIEEGRTNLALQSGAIVLNSGWFTDNVTSTVSGTGPDGNSSYLIAESTAVGAHSLANNGGSGGLSATSVVSGTTYTGSIFIKKVTGSVDWVQLTFSGVGFGTAQYANFNLATGQVGNSAGLASGTTPRIESFANGWYRCSFSVVATTTTSISNNVIVAFLNNTNGTTRLPSYTGSTSNRFLVSLCQFEVGAFATSYIPTTTSALARSADVCSITGANFAGMWNALEGSVLANCIYYSPVTNTNGQRIWEATDGTTSNFIRSFRTASTGFADFRNISGGSTNVTITGSSALSSFQTIKHSYGFADNDYVFYVNNSQIGTDNLGNMLISPNAMYIGLNSPSIGAGQISGTISAIRYYRKRLSNAKLQALTA
jgi:hypothetical protein